MAKIKITLVRSRIGSDKRQVATLNALGLGKVNSSVEHETSPQIMGMVAKVQHLVRCGGSKVIVKPILKSIQWI